MKLGEWIGLLSILATFYILWKLRAILLLVFMAVILAIALNSLVRRLQQTGIPKQFTIPIVLSTTFLSITLFLLGVVPPFVAQFNELLKVIIDGIDRIPLILANTLEFLGQNVSLPGQLRFPESEEFLNWLQSVEILNWNTLFDSAVLDVFSNFFSFFNSSLRVLLQVLLVVILSLMFLGNPTVYRNSLLRLIPSFYRRRADGILQECEVALCNWMGGIVLNSVFIFLLSFVGLLLLGIEFPFANALLAGVLNFIPNVGPSLSVIFPAIVALTSDPLKIIPVIVWYAIIQQIESYWLTPTVMARQISLPPAFTLIAQICFAAIFGFLGLVLALPLAVVAKIWMQELLVKDILDRWKKSNQKPWQPAIAGAALPAATDPPSGIDQPSNEDLETSRPVNND
ncbi:AI-2E family transporter [Leptothoe kymatousa]|uniref:AI-2E family transporter n=1 Tax=Leptothoe kymatousa TAU-MAC 1615 TaxID=2364775 RepID=A0ABS5Y264_9CYAN|nr:AI-2E family transporter [Leptothoe kymatousa]MBT9311934.1 AI-2E family transporter [Leptothoe kymatousa TAU-MAC 1615]